MKRILLISAAMLTAAAGWAQSCGGSNPLFNFNNAGEAKEVSKLGTNPEFPFLRNLASPAQVAAAMKKADRDNAPGADHMNEMLMAIGFANGAKDVSASNISMYYMPLGTTGNMGSGNYTNGYYRLTGDASEFKSWKVSNGTCAMYFMAKCGNAFYPNEKKTAACITVPVNVTTNDAKDVTLTATGQKLTSNDNTYIYYHRKRHKKSEKPYSVAGVNDQYPSQPLLLNTQQKVDVVPETYKVTVNAANNSMNVCPDSTLKVAANISLEKTSSYAGYYPSAKKEFKKVSKHVYKKAERKMRKAARKEHKVAKATGVPVKHEQKS